MHGAHTRKPMEQGQVNFQWIRIQAGMHKQAQGYSQVFYVTYGEKRRCSAHLVSTSPRHDISQIVTMARTEVFPRSRGKLGIEGVI